MLVLALKWLNYFLRNKVIITGRNADRLAKAADQLENVTSIVSDVTNAEDTAQLVDVLKKDFPSLNIVINNAGFAHVYNLIDIEVEAFQKAQEEIVTNYLSIVRLNEKLLPLLKQNESSAIACGKYRFNALEFGDINGILRLLDIGQA